MALSFHAPKDGRLLAVVLLAIVLMLVYLIGVHWWFVAPQMQYRKDMQDLREEQLRFHQIAMQRPEIEKRLSDVHAYEQGNQAFLSETDTNAASAGLIQRLNAAIAEHVKDDKRCQSISQSSYNGGEDELYQRVTIQVRMRCDLEPLSTVLYDLENGKPYLYVDQLMIYRQQVYRPANSKQAASPLDVRFNLSGYLRLPGKVEKAEKVGKAP